MSTTTEILNNSIRIFIDKMSRKEGGAKTSKTSDRISKTVENPNKIIQLLTKLSKKEKNIKPAEISDDTLMTISRSISNNQTNVVSDTPTAPLKVKLVTSLQLKLKAVTNDVFDKFKQLKRKLSRRSPKIDLKVTAKLQKETDEIKWNYNPLYVSKEQQEVEKETVEETEELRWHYNPLYSPLQDD